VGKVGILMRFIHTADWHLGRSFYNVSLIDDQAHVLNQLIDLAKGTKPDVMVIAGDVYDRALPSTEAVKLLDDVLCRLILDLKLPVILIGGNHDSPLRLEFAARLMETHRLYVFSSLSERIQSIEFVDLDKGGNVTFFPLPYAEPSHTAEFFNNPEINSHEAALRRWIACFKEKHLAGSRVVLINHAYVAGSEATESERPLDIGGTDTVSAECFNDFDYAALGHLHRSQTLGQKGHIHYPGSLLKYSFSEVTQIKGVKLVEMDAKGKCKVEDIHLLPKHDVRCVEGTIDDLLVGKTELGNKEDYIQVQLTDTGAVFDAMSRLREVLPNIVTIDHPSITPFTDNIKPVDVRKRDVASLFGDFYHYVTSEELTKEQATAFSDIVNRMRETERQE
jgi:exonuclease SbcD